MLKYSIAAVALVATSTFALADPNTGGAPGASLSGGAGGAAMDHSGGGSPAGAMKGGTTEGNGGPGMNKSDARPSKSVDGGMKGDRSAAGATGEEHNAKDRNRQVGESEGKMKNGQHSDRVEDRAERNEGKSSKQAHDNGRADNGATGAGEGAEGKARPRGTLTNVNPEQKTRVRAAFGGHRVAPARDIGIAVNVGVVVPRTVHFYPLPPEIVTIAPDYDGYEYFMIDESHVAVVDPDTLEVVDIIVVS